MEVRVRTYQPADLSAMRDIWNAVVQEGLYFPQIMPLSEAEAAGFFAGQSFTGVAEQDGEIVGLYILHPNNIGRCGHIANASYAVKASARGLHVGEALVRHSLLSGRERGFRILQFNAVVKSNQAAIHLYTKLGFAPLGTIPGGFHGPDGQYADILLFYREL